ncbi:hypothetical protein [Hyphomicrobium sp. CS1GBMeth3]|uniref:hypothetical protein n=1 Tax=Hyphomicrobium sp. CS1GBMeth3 TaxID=1892845 RepID=UPI000931B0F4|nr:hypothetical protein [Hyphomicrobium sp. CS1GBMeth3]
MNPFDFAAPAELFPARGRGLRRGSVTYKRFDSAADAIRFAIEELDPVWLFGAILEVDDERFDGVAIKNLYGSDAYPLKRGDNKKGDGI